MDEAQQQVVLGIRVGGGDIAGEAEQHLVALVQPVADLETGLDAALERLKPGGRLAVISFHSLEDRIVKQFMARHAKAPPANRRMPVEIAFTPTLRLVGGAQKADEAELAANPRARSAVLRVAEKLPVEGREVAA